MATYKYVKVIPDNYQDFVEVYRQFLGVPKLFDEQVTTLESFKDRLGNSFLAILSYKDLTVTGFVAALLIQKLPSIHNQTGQMALIHGPYTRPDFRRKGFATHCLEQLYAALLLNKTYEVFTYSSEENLDFFLHKGFNLSITDNKFLVKKSIKETPTIIGGITQPNRRKVFEKD